MAVVAIGPASAATVTTTWNAKVGSAGVNGTARIQVFTTGTGALTLELVKLRASRTLPVVISKGTCKTVGTTVATLSSVRTTSGGAATRTISLTAAQIKLIKAATKGTGKIAIRVGSGTNRKCGAFVLAAPPVVGARVVATIPVGVDPAHVAIDASGIWVTNFYDSTLSRIDPATNAVLSVSSVEVPGRTAPEAITTGFGSLWVTFLQYDDLDNPMPGFVVRVDPITGSALGAPIPVGRHPLVITASTDSIWVANNADQSLSRIDPLTNLVTATIPVGDSPFGVAAGFGSIWVTNVSDGKVTRIDPSTNQAIATIQTQRTALAVTVGAGAVWVSSYGHMDQPGSVVSRIDPATNMVVAAVQVGDYPGFVAFGGGYLWVEIDSDSSVVQIDPATNAVKKRIPVEAKSWGLAASDHAVWVVHPTAAGVDPSLAVPGTVTRINF